MPRRARIRRRVCRFFRPLFERHRHLSDVSDEAIAGFGEVINMPVGEDVATPSVRWLRQQALAVRTLHRSLRMPLNPLTHAIIRGGRKKYSEFPKVARLCRAHAGLDPRVLSHMETMVLAETGHKFKALRRYRNERGIRDHLPMKVHRWLGRMALIGGIWHSVEAYDRKHTLGFGGRLKKDGDALQLGSLARGDRNDCAACNLAAIGSRAQALIDIRAGCLARRLFRRSRKSPPLIRLIDAWITCFGEQKAAEMGRPAAELSRAIRDGMMLVNGHDESEFGKPWDGVPVNDGEGEEHSATPAAGFEGDSSCSGNDEPSDEPSNEPMDDSTIGSGIHKSTVTQTQNSSSEAAYSPLRPHEQIDDDGASDYKRTTSQPSDLFPWRRHQSRGSEPVRSTYTNHLRSEFTHPSAIPLPLGRLRHRATPVPEANERVSTRTVDAHLNDVSPVIPPRGSISAGTTGHVPRTPTALVSPSARSRADDEASWVSMSVHTLATTSSRATSCHRPAGPEHGSRLSSVAVLGTTAEEEEETMTPSDRWRGSRPTQHTPERRLSQDTQLREMREREEQARNSPYFSLEPSSSSFYSQ